MQQRAAPDERRADAELRRRDAGRQTGELAASNLIKAAAPARRPPGLY